MTDDKHLFTSETAKQARAKAAPRGESKLKRMFKEYADAEDIAALFCKLKEMALEGDMDAIKTLLNYLIGKPVETKNISMDAEINDKRKPSWFRTIEDENSQNHISIINSEVKSELQ